MKIQGKVCVVTGGASGLGAATAQHLVAQGAKVILVDMNQELGQQLQQQLGENADFVAVDVTDENQVQQLFNHIEHKYGQLNGLVNCAGIGTICPKSWDADGLHDLAMFQKVLNINVTGSFNIRSVLQHNLSGEILT